MHPSAGVAGDPRGAQGRGAGERGIGIPGRRADRPAPQGSLSEAGCGHRGPAGPGRRRENRVDRGLRRLGRLK
ncbi:hypothetical protein ACFFX0_11445 [Citricoccus parietis]|uniref:Uncharacterized protein n=1 Tax=Citricoccus parietis TaxID=592307 RepID=A0ABV5FYL9_9MICC